MQTLSSVRRPKPFKRCVFLSFGEDTKQGFSNYLRKDLNDRGFRTGEGNSEAIGEPRIFIVVLSAGYVSSPSCLDELVEIIKFAEVKRRRILPVFYYVSPSEVRHQIGMVGKALADHAKSDKLDEWVKAMEKEADTVGWHIDGARDKYEYQYIEEIVQQVSEHVACAIGLYPRVQEVMQCLYSGSDDEVCVVGICGVPGIGKTTVAHRVSDCNADKGFDCHDFIDKAGRYLGEPGLLHLQRRLLSKIVGANVNGMSIENVLKQNKIFLTLKDVDDAEQLEAFLELTNWFGPGSKVIITTQDNQLLKRPEIKKIYEVKRFNDIEAYKLLNLKVFKSRHVKADYVSIIKEAATYASGLPFHLEVIGSNLCGKGIEDCRSTLKKYKKIPNKETQGILQVSFDTLEENQREMLIHIACYLRDKRLTMVEGILKNIFGGFPKEVIKVLRDKSLIKIDEYGRVTLHDLTLLMVTEYGKREIQPASSNGSMIGDLTELELPYEHGSSSSSQNAL